MHAGFLIEPRGAGQALGIDVQGGAYFALLLEYAKGMMQ